MPHCKSHNKPISPLLPLEEADPCGADSHSKQDGDGGDVHRALLDLVVQVVLEHHVCEEGDPWGINGRGGRARMGKGAGGRRKEREDARTRTSFFPGGAGGWRRREGYG